ncbi:MAG: FG-GAP-like repeat-containing protein, partial [Bacteroidota bacterium]
NDQKMIPKICIAICVFCFHSLLSSQILFENNAQIRGIDMTCGNGFLGNGVSFFDYDNDGWDDITLTTDGTNGIAFYKNYDGFFVEQTLNIPLIDYQTKQVNWVDYDNDGDYDLFVTSDTNGNRLFNNTGNLNFEDVTVAANLPLDNLFTFGASWGDYNKDGFLDVFISNRDINLLIPNFLFKNNGDGTFSNVSVAAGIGTESHLSFCSAFFDFNNDGFQDIYVSNDKVSHANLLYHNNADGTFTEAAAITGTDVSIDAMTVTVGDYNNDGWFDLYITNSPTGNVFFRNNGDTTFTDIAASTGTTFNSVGWGAVFFDAENDTDLDLYVSASETGSSASYISAAFYRNQGSDAFTIPNDAGFANDNRSSYSNAIGDINNDGYADLVVSNVFNEDIFLWENLSNTTNNWLKVKLEGTTSNRDGIGSVIEVSANGGKQYRYTLCGEGYLSQNSGTEFFGLGPHSVIDYVKVKWLSGTEDILYNVTANQLLTIVEGTSPLSVNEFENTAFTITPNPTEDRVSVTSSSLIESVELYNNLGQIVLKSKVNKEQIHLDLSSYTSGIYILKASTSSGSSTKKIVKQ